MKVVAFQIEIKGQKNIVTAEKAFASLNKQLIQTNDLLKEIQKDSGKNLNNLGKDFSKTADSAEKLGDVVKTSFQSFEKGNKIVQGLGDNYQEVSKSVEDAATELKKIETIVEGDTKSIKDLIDRNKELKKILESAPKAGTAAFEEQKEELEELAQEYAANRKEIVAFRKSLKDGNVETEKASGSVNELKERQKQLQKQYNSLTKSQQKGLFGEGAKIAREIKKIDQRLKDLNDRTKATGRLSKTLTKTFTRLFIGRSILSGAANVIRSVTDGLKNLVAEGDKSNDVLAGLETSGNRLTGSLRVVGTSLLNSFGSGISQVIDNVAFSVKVVGDAFIETANSGSTLGNILSAVGSIFTDFPAIIGGVGNVIQNFTTAAATNFENFKLNAQAAFLAFRRNVEGFVGRDVSQIEERLADINRRLQENAANSTTFASAYREGFENTKKAQEEFNAEIDAQNKLEEQRLEGIARREKASKEAAAAEKKRLEELARQRNELLKQIRDENTVRIQLIQQLNDELTAAEVEAIEDATQKALAAEQLRFEQENLLREKNFNERLNEVKQQQKRLEELFGEFSEEAIKFEQESGSELQQLRDVNDQIAEQKEQQHQDNLLKIQKDAKEKELQAEKDFFAELEEELEAEFEAEAAIDDAKVQASIEKDKELLEEKKKNLSQFLDFSQQISDTLFDSIAKFTEIANQAETARLDAAISNREKSIADLNEKLANATGLQKKFLEQQVEAEKKALAEEQAAREKAEKERVKQAQALALVQAIINGALAITRAFSDLGPIAGAIAAVGVAAGIAAQIATIANQQFAEGGVLSGPSHAGGGVPVSVGGKGMVEAEGGEAIINRRSTSMFRPLLSAINQAGGGKKFQTGGVIGPAITAPAISGAGINENFQQFVTAFSARTEALNNRINKTEVVLDLNNLQDVQDNDSSLDVLTTL